MKKVDDQIGYDLNEQDIDAVLHYMKLNDPENATPERAVRFLVMWKKRTVQLKIVSQINFPLNSWFTYRLGLFGGVTVGEELSPYYHYKIGGIFEQNMGNLFKFQGYEFGQLYSKNMLIAANTFQFNFYKNYFFDANLSIGNLFNDIKVDDILHITESSAGITAGYKSPFGQIKFNYSKSLNRNNNIFSVILGHWF